MGFMIGSDTDTTGTIEPCPSTPPGPSQPLSVAARKRELRRSILHRRRSITRDELTAAGRQLEMCTTRYVESLPAGSTVAAYVSMGHEIPTTATLRRWSERGLSILVPRLGSGTQIGWGHYAGASALVPMPRSASGGLRPDEPAGEILGPEALQSAQVVLIPALAVDSRHRRLGRGLGWYDRALLHCGEHATVVAVCWPWEISETPLPVDTQDMPVDDVVRLH